MAREPHGTTVQGWKRLLDSLTDKELEPQMQDYRETLQTLYQEALDLAAKRDAHRAAKQEASRALADTLERGRRLKTLMRFQIKNMYGPDSERLVEFGIRPRRLIRKKHKPAQ
jgi:transposase